MADAKVNIVGNSDDAQRAVDKLRASFEKLEEKLRNQAKFSKQAKTAGDSYLQSQQQFAQSLLVNIVSVQTAWALATKLLAEYMAANQRVQDLRGLVATNARETEIKIINQGQLNKEEASQTMENINTQVRAIPATDVTGARRMTEEMFSQNFERQHTINADNLRSMLRLKAAANQFGAGAMDDKLLITSVAAIIRNTSGRDSTAPIMPQEIDQVAKEFHALFLKGTIQLPDLEFLARIKSVLAARGVDDKTQLAAFSVAKDAFSSGDVGANFLAQSANFMSKGGSQDMAKKLKKSGIDIDAGRYDLIGEDFTQALQNLKDDLDKMEARQKADTITTLYGTKSATGVLTFLSKIPAIRAERNKIENAGASGGVDDAVEEFMTSPHARSAKTSVNAEIESIEGLKTQGEMTFADVEKIIAATYEQLSQQNLSSHHLFIDTMMADLRKKIGLNKQTPQEYLDTLQHLSELRAEGDPWGSDARKSADILNQQIDMRDPRTQQMEAWRERARAEDASAAAAGGGAIVFPENIQVNDPNLQTSVDQMNETLTSMLAMMGEGPDRQRVVKLPARSSANA